MSKGKETSEYFSVRFKEIEGRSRVWRAIVEDLEPHLASAGTVVDIGTGYGDFINNVHAKTRIGIDLLPDSKQYLKPGITFAKASITKLPLRAASADVVFASNLFEHLTEAEVGLACAEVKRVLKRSGRLVLVQPNWRYAYRNYYDDYTHRSVFSDVSLPDRLTAAGFTIDTVKAKYLPLTMRSRLPRSYWLTKLYLLLPFKPVGGQMLVVARKP